MPLERNPCGTSPFGVYSQSSDQEPSRVVAVRHGSALSCQVFDGPRLLHSSMSLQRNNSNHGAQTHVPAIHTPHIDEHAARGRRQFDYLQQSCQSPFPRPRRIALRLYEYVSMIHNEETSKNEVIQPLIDAAKKQNKCNLLTNFQKAVLFSVVEQNAGKASYSDMLLILEDCIRARQELHDLEREMDQETFVNIVTGGFFQRRGTDAATNSPICWIRYGDLCRKSWRIPADSSIAKAYIRALLWFSEVATVQTSLEKGQRLVLYADSNVGMLDFNIDIVSKAAKFSGRIFPAHALGIMYLFGVPSVVPMFYNTMCRSMPNHVRCLHVCAEYEDALDLVTCEDDVPHFWLDEDASVEDFCLDRTSTWCYERCLTDGNRITTKDVLNAGPWPFPRNAKCAKKKASLTPNSHSNRLEVIEE